MLCCARLAVMTTALGGDGVSTTASSSHRQSHEYLSSTTDSPSTPPSAASGRRSRPRSLAVNWRTRTPGYAMDTVSSLQQRASHVRRRDADGDEHYDTGARYVCCRYRKSVCLLRLSVLRTCYCRHCRCRTSTCADVVETCFPNQ